MTCCVDVSRPVDPVGDTRRLRRDARVDDAERQLVLRLPGERLSAADSVGSRPRTERHVSVDDVHVIFKMIANVFNVRVEKPFSALTLV